jgi:hypothetical protein
MFDKYLIVEDSLRTLVEDGEVTGFCFKARLGYYRGLGLSMVEAMDVTIDGTEVPREAVRIDDGEGWLTLDEMETAFDRRWRFGEAVDVAVHGQPLGTGEHELTLRQQLRVSYMPFPSVNKDTKRLSLGS